MLIDNHSPIPDHQATFRADEIPSSIVFQESSRRVILALDTHWVDINVVVHIHLPNSSDEGFEVLEERSNDKTVLDNVELLTEVK